MQDTLGSRAARAQLEGRGVRARGGLRWELFALNPLDSKTPIMAKIYAAVTAGGGAAQQAAAEGMLSAALGRLIALAEAYPDLKANTNFQQLQTELANVENKLAAARRFFNNAVSEYNAAMQAFPAVLFAAAMGFQQRDFFDVGQDDRKRLDAPPEVKF
jgi:LemA protein